MRKLVLLLGCFAASPLAAGETRLTGEAIKATLGGSHLEMDTPVGTTVSIRIGHDGLMSGEAGTALGAVLGASKDRGRWWTAQDQVCFKWFRWFDAEERCATISLDGNRLTWRREDGDSGTATIVESGKPIEKPAVVVAQAKQTQERQEKPSAKKAEATLAQNPRKTESSITVAEKAPIAAPKSPPAQVPAIAPSRASEETTVALQVPTPHPAVRPKSHQEKIAVTVVKPQFFAAAHLKTRVAKVQVAKAEAPKIEPQASARKPFRVAGVDPSDVLNIRNGPSSDYDSVGGIPPNSRGITITGPCQNDWCPVKHGALVGWANRKYLTEETASNTTAVSDEPNYWDPAP